jgi:Ca-activated chloride channel family protein
MRILRWVLLGSVVLSGTGCGRSPEGVPSPNSAAGQPRGNDGRLDSESSADVGADPELDDLGPVAADAPAATSAQRPVKSAEVARKTKEALQQAEPVTQAGTTPPANANTEAYSKINDNPFTSPKNAPLSTFSIDVDTAAYANMRRFLRDGALPPADAVRIEELVNYFSYAYPQPAGDAPFSVTTELGEAPWQGDHRVLRIGLQGKRLSAAELPPRNLVFLIDVSGSMSDPNKLPLVKFALRELTKTLGAKDHVGIVVYAGASGVVLPSTGADQRARVLEAIDRLEAGGSTNGAAGIEAAYALAEHAFNAGGVNRVILATDGDFNVGVSSAGELVRLIEKKREKGVFLTVLGFGMGNYKDSNLEQLADHGNGNYAYIDTEAEARKVLVDQGGSTLFTIAKDVKIQVEFNPQQVAAYRLIGYENRALAAQDFNDDRKDAGEIGPGHSVTALYEIIPVGAVVPKGSVDALKYQQATATGAASQGELATVKLRFKRPRATQSELLTLPVGAKPLPVAATSPDFRFACAVSGFGMLLRGSEFRGSIDYRMVRSLAESAGASKDPSAHRGEFLTLVQRAEQLDRRAVLTAR